MLYGVKCLCVAPLLTEVDGSVPTYDTSKAKVVSHLTKVDISENRSDVKVFGDNALVIASNDLTDRSINIGTTTMEMADREMLLGWVKWGTPSGSEPQEYAVTDAPGPLVGVGYVKTGSHDNGTKFFRGEWCYKCQFAQNESVETKGETVNFQTPELTGKNMAVRPNASLTNVFAVTAEFADEADAIAWVKGKAGIAT
jgi:hypothetical protein